MTANLDAIVEKSQMLGSKISCPSASALVVALVPRKEATKYNIEYFCNYSIA